MNEILTNGVGEALERYFGAYHSNRRAGAYIATLPTLEGRLANGNFLSVYVSIYKQPENTRVDRYLIHSYRLFDGLYEITITGDFKHPFPTSKIIYTVATDSGVAIGTRENPETDQILTDWKTFQGLATLL